MVFDVECGGSPLAIVSKEIVLVLDHTVGFAIAEHLVEFLLTRFAPTIDACLFDKPIHRSLDACGGGYLLDGIA